MEEINRFMWYILALVTVILIGFFFMVSSLLIMHTYLISKNLTTWEYLSWMKISYMKVWPKKYGSPFDRGGSKANLKFFFRFDFTKGNYLYPWSMPKKLPKLVLGV
jgi:palmitoyltransferase